MRGAIAALLALALALALAGSADAFYGPVDLTTYEALAVAQWGATPCGGVVTIQWAHEPAEINARSTWMAPSADAPAATYGSCVVTLSLDRDWSIEMLCTVVVHEYGHLTGHPHVADPTNVMSPYYEAGQAPECVTPAPPTIASTTSPSRPRSHRRLRYPHLRLGAPTWGSRAESHPSTTNRRLVSVWESRGRLVRGRPL